MHSRKKENVLVQCFSCLPSSCEIGREMIYENANDVDEENVSEVQSSHLAFVNVPACSDPDMQ